MVYNLNQAPVNATMTGWDLDPGKWEVVQGVDQNGDDVVDGATTRSTVELERTGSIELKFAPRGTTVLNLRLVAKDVSYWERPELGISAADVRPPGTSNSGNVRELIPVAITS